MDFTERQNRLISFNPTTTIREGKNTFLAKFSALIALKSVLNAESRWWALQMMKVNWIVSNDVHMMALSCNTYIEEANSLDELNYAAIYRIELSEALLRLYLCMCLYWIELCHVTFQIHIWTSRALRGEYKRKDQAKSISSTHCKKLY